MTGVDFNDHGATYHPMHGFIRDISYIIHENIIKCFKRLSASVTPRLGQCLESRWNLPILLELNDILATCTRFVYICDSLMTYSIELPLIISSENWKGIQLSIFVDKCVKTSPWTLRRDASLQYLRSVYFLRMKQSQQHLLKWIGKNIERLSSYGFIESNNIYIVL